MEINWSLGDLKKAVFTSAVLIILLNAVLFLIHFEDIFAASEKKSLLALALFLLQAVFFIFPIIFFILQKYSITASIVGFRAIGFFQAAGYATRGYFYGLFLNLLIFTLAEGKLLPGFSKQQQYFELFGNVRSSTDLGIAFFVLVLLAPVVEEFVFRGIILQTLMKYLGTVKGNIITAIFFAVIHFQFQSFVLLLVLSFVLNWIFIKTRSLYATIAFHLLNNGIAFAVQWSIFTGKIPLERFISSI